MKTRINIVIVILGLLIWYFGYIQFEELSINMHGNMNEVVPFLFYTTMGMLVLIFITGCIAINEAVNKNKHSDNMY